MQLYVMIRANTVEDQGKSDFRCWLVSVSYDNSGINDVRKIYTSPEATATTLVLRLDDHAGVEQF